MYGPKRESNAISVLLWSLSPADRNIKVTRKGTEVNISDDVEKAVVFCEYFSTVFTHENTEDTPDMLNITQKSVWLPIKFSEDIMLQKLNKIYTSKSAGPDELHPKILYEVKNEISLPLSLLFETSFRLKQLPQDWITADIATIHKKEAKLM